MTSPNPDAIAAALSMIRDPHLARLAWSSPLPKGMTFLLELAAGEAEALSSAHAITGRSEATLQKAAGFFVEQVLLSRRGDNYRVLGAARDTPTADLRRHMALLLKWLHPDLFSGSGDDKGFNRSAYVNLVIEAWETLKTGERRAAYDAALMLQERSTTKKKTSGANGKSKHAGPSGYGTRHGQWARERRVVLYELERGSFWSRLLSYIGILR